MEQYDNKAINRFWSKVDKRGVDDCWPWTGPKTHGYGDFTIGRKHHRAHKVSWELTHSEAWPLGKIGCHHCDVPACVNPRHIYPGTQLDNMRDAVRRGRNKLPDSSHRKLWTHCPRGHEFTSENTLIQGGKYRKCKACNTATKRAYRQRIRALQKTGGA